jgi:hypothetical protein
MISSPEFFLSIVGKMSIISPANPVDKGTYKNA